MPGGRPTLYDPKYCDEIVAYFSREIPDEIGKDQIVKPPMLSRFAMSIGVQHDTLLNWTEKHSEFLGAYKKAKDLQTQFIQEGMIAGVFQGGAAVFAAKNMTDMRDKTEIDHTNAGGKFETPPMTPAVMAATKAYEEALKKVLLD